MKIKHLTPFILSLFSVGFLTSCNNVPTNKEVPSVDDFLAKNEETVEAKITLSFPGNNQSISILKPNVVNYIDAMHKQAEAIVDDYIPHDFYAYADSKLTSDAIGSVSNDTDKVRIRDYLSSNNESKSKNVSFVFDATGFAEGTEFVVKVSQNEDLSNAIEVETTGNYVTVNNLFAGATYYWQVSSKDNSVQSPIQNFKTNDGFRMVTAEGITNIRDIGGRRVSGGKRIKQGLIFRGSELVDAEYNAPDSGDKHSKTLTEENKKVLQDELLIGYEFDFRGNAEANNITESPLKDETHNVLYKRISSVTSYDYTFAKSDAEWALVEEMFRAFINANERHVYFHCWGGADRTGTTAFLLAAVLGSSITDLIIDFELTSFSRNVRPHDEYTKIYRMPSLLYEIFKGDFFAPFREENKPLKDIIADYMISKTNLTQADFDALRENLLED